MVRCNATERRDIHPVYSEGGDAGKEERIRSRIWQHMCQVDQKRWYNDSMRSGCLDLSEPFNTRVWKAHHDVNLAYGLSRINNAQQRAEVDRYCGYEPNDGTSECRCGWRAGIGAAGGVQPGPEHPCTHRRPRYTRAAEAQREINAFQRDRRDGLQAVTANGQRFAWPDTLRPLTLATFGRDADADWCLFKNPVKLVPINMSRKEKVFTR